VPRLGCSKVKATTTRLLRGSYRMTSPRICCRRVKAVEGQLQIDRTKDRLWQGQGSHDKAAEGQL
jgi:hypothetical protein